MADDQAAGLTPHGRDLERGTQLLDRVVGFGRYLRLVGLHVTLGQTMDFAKAVPAVGLVREDFKLAARATFVARREDGPLFDKAFDLYWRYSTFSDDDSPYDQSGDMPPPDPTDADDELSIPAPGKDKKEGKDSENAEKGTGQQEAVEGENAEDVDPDTMLTFSASEALKGKDFAQFNADEMAKARFLMEKITWKITMRRSRRTVRAAKGRYLDMRRTFRANMKYGGEMLELSHRRRKMKPRRVVLICDISGSMDRYSRLLLQFVHTVEQGLSRVEVFVFGTRLTRITRQLRVRNIDSALERVSKEVQDWAGGTRIGESLLTFNTRWARRVLGQGAIVMIISDGWDRGDVDVLRREMARLQRMSFRLIWLNPLLGSPTYQPLTRGIQAALPYVDDFLPVHNLNSLEALAASLGEVTAHRPVRSQTAHRTDVLNKK